MILTAGHSCCHDSSSIPIIAALSSCAIVCFQLVFLSACYSESVAAAVVKAGVPHVVVVKSEHDMLDKTALDFTRAFYRNLLKGHSVSQSFRNVSAAARIHLSLFLCIGSRTYTALPVTGAPVLLAL